MSDKDNSSSTNNLFNATPSLLGYLYQCRVALLESVKRINNATDFTTYIESLDDVSFESDGAPMELLQTKHHIGKKSDLSDYSPDLWKTIRIWSEGISKNTIPSDAQLFLITTEEASPDTIAWYLKSESSRNIDLALSAMNSVASTSRSETNKLGYKAFRELTHEQKLQLLNSITVADLYPKITEIENKLKKELYFAVAKKNLLPFLDRLEGWWWKRVLRQLTSSTSDPILSEEISSEIDELREQFKQDNLPIDDDIISFSVDSTDNYEAEIFVNQLRLIGINTKRILHAIRNYYRAFNQRSRWIKDDLLMVGELDKYENLLLDEWEIRFEQMIDDLGEEAAEAIKVQAAQTLYKWVESGSLPMIRPNVSESFIARGSYHILANTLRLGWHAEFKERLKALLGVEEEEQK